MGGRIEARLHFHLNGAENNSPFQLLLFRTLHSSHCSVWELTLEERNLFFFFLDVEWSRRIQEKKSNVGKQAASSLLSELGGPGLL